MTSSDKNSCRAYEMVMDQLNRCFILLKRDLNDFKSLPMKKKKTSDN